MSLVVETRPLGKIFLNVCALIFGYSLWHVVSKPYIIQATLNLPVSFYNQSPTDTVDAPDSIQVTVAGTRSALFKAAYTASLHCDAHSLTPGTNSVIVSEQQIFLPETISLLDCSQKKIVVTVTPTSKTL